MNWSVRIFLYHEQYKTTLCNIMQQDLVEASLEELKCADCWPWEKYREDGETERSPKPGSKSQHWPFARKISQRATWIAKTQQCDSGNPHPYIHTSYLHNWRWCIQCRLTKWHSRVAFFSMKRSLILKSHSRANLHSGAGLRSRTTSSLRTACRQK